MSSHDKGWTREQYGSSSFFTSSFFPSLSLSQHPSLQGYQYTSGHHHGRLDKCFLCFRHVSSKWLLRDFRREWRSWTWGATSARYSALEAEMVPMMPPTKITTVCRRFAS